MRLSPVSYPGRVLDALIYSQRSLVYKPSHLCKASGPDVSLGSPGLLFGLLFHIITSELDFFFFPFYFIVFFSPIGWQEGWKLFSSSSSQLTRTHVCKQQRQSGRLVRNSGSGVQPTCPDHLCTSVNHWPSQRLGVSRPKMRIKHLPFRKGGCED